MKFIDYEKQNPNKALIKAKKLHKCKRCELFTDELENNLCYRCNEEL